MLRTSLLSQIQKINNKPKSKKPSKRSQKSKSNSLSRQSQQKKKNDYSVNLHLDLSHKKTKSSSTKNETFVKSDLLDFASSGQLPSKSKIKTARGYKKDQYFSTRVNQLQKKKRYQPTPILTPIISQRNSNCPTTIREMEGLNNKESQKLTMLKKYIDQDQEKIKTAKKRVQAIDCGNFTQIQTNKLKQQLKISQSAIEQSARKYHSLVKSHKNDMEILNKQICNINEQLKKQVIKRTKLQGQLAQSQKQVSQSKNMIKQKNIQIEQIKHTNQQISDENTEMKGKIDKFTHKVYSLEKNIDEFERMRQQMELKLNKAQLEKKYIKKNTQDVLRMLREDFGSAFGRITKQPKETQQYLSDLSRNY